MNYSIKSKRRWLICWRRGCREEIRCCGSRQVFGISKGRAVAGSMVTEGTIYRSGKARLMRKGKLVFEGAIETLRRFKDDVKEVRAGYECGINIKGCNEYEEGDILECYQIEKKKPSLR